ncbi:hypothetical protein NADFUDRAFT_36338 [Nadsonia fulvescens var. elongata DSM 6958]|uniref:RRM domain-containing protein n=1 Tax=Nadsonia fulvescens var. elongata DSM 6958 TaxID=857566 RepID=A0A1E3PGY7_9ASCO|nr:hypothetical protein NADFUDRAFT_36338 [Nadsonia fulvescens var. elongata DSM 6958]
MRSYFSQFGTVVKLRLSRNKKTGKSKHFAFLEFSSPDVAQIVADTMDNYLLFGHILKCKVVPKDKIHQDLFVGANKTFRAIPWGKIAKHKNDSPKSQAQWEKLTKKSLDKSVAKKEALAELGIKYSMK